MATVMDRPPTTTSSFPINFQADYPSNPGRLYAVPIIGLAIRYILLIPHLIALYILAILVGIVQLFAWIPVLTAGSFSEALYSFEAGFLRWSDNVGAYLLGLTDSYPPFALGQQDDFSVRVSFERPQSSNRLFAIPIVGYVLRYILLIPHFIALAVLGIVALLVALVAWIPVFASGTYPSWAYQLFTGLLRWHTRVFGYFFGLTDAYPPFSFS